jgi:Cu2+-containing amine oxidase
MKVSILGNFSNWEKFLFKESFMQRNGIPLYMLSYAIIESLRK